MFLGHGDDLSFVVSGVSFDTLAKRSTEGIETADRLKEDLRDPGAVAEGFANVNLRKAGPDGQLGLSPTNLLDPDRRGAAMESRRTGPGRSGLGPLRG
jgi:hypothetical protein